MSEEIKAAHAMLEASENQGVFYWKCLCGAAGDGDVSPGAAVDGHAEHAQESGEYGLPGGFVVRNSEHGQECKECARMARKAVREAIANQKPWGIAELDQRIDPWDGPEITHWARVARVSSQGQEQKS